MSFFIRDPRTVGTALSPMGAVFAGEAAKRPPVWLMRQAGRYLPEYRALRARAPNFLAFCFTPELAVEATLQPIRRFGFDAAIVFSDILVVPHAFGQAVGFFEGEGPRLDPVPDRDGLRALAGSIDLERISAVFSTMRGARSALPADVPLIGFCGAPWTVATYMVAGRGTPDQAPARLFAYRDPEGFGELIDRLVSGSIAYLEAQISAGAQVIQIFDSWAGVLPDGEFDRWCVRPVRAIIEAVRGFAPDVPIIAFPRGMSMSAGEYVRKTQADAIGFDTSADLGQALRDLPARCVSQGNLDPLALMAGGDALDAAISHLQSNVAGRRHIVNLGHGILPETPIAHVERLIERVRG